MKIRNSIECYILIKKSDSFDVLLMHKPERSTHPSFYQPITGGIEENEEALDACIREVNEETGIALNKKNVNQLDYKYEFFTNCNEIYVKKNLFLVIMDKKPDIVISDEHDGYMWTDIKKAYENLYWDSNKNAYKKIIRTVFPGNNSQNDL